MEWKDIAQLVSGGGVVAFAGLVWWSLRDFRAELEKHRDEETETRKELATVGQTLAMILERQRMTDTGPIARLPRLPSEPR